MLSRGGMVLTEFAAAVRAGERQEVPEPTGILGHLISVVTAIHL